LAECGPRAQQLGCGPARTHYAEGGPRTQQLCCGTARPTPVQPRAQQRGCGTARTHHAEGGPRAQQLCCGTARPTPVHNRFAALNLLTDDAEVLLCAVTGEVRGGKVVEAVVDSGAVHSVTPPSVFPGPVTPSPWSRAGRGYRAANGTGIKNLGQVKVPFGTAEGHKCLIPFQVAEVEQPLLSVAHLAAAGNRVELGHTDGRVVNLHTGREIALERRGGVYILKMFIPDAAVQLPFRRQGA